MSIRWSALEVSEAMDEIEALLDQAEPLLAQAEQKAIQATGIQHVSPLIRFERAYQKGQSKLNWSGAINSHCPISRHHRAGGAL